MIDLQKMVKTYLCDHGIMATKYNNFVRVAVLDTYLNIRCEEDNLAIIIGPMSRGCEMKLVGRLEDPSNIVLKNLLEICKKAQALDKCLGIITGGNFP